MLNINENSSEGRPQKAKRVTRQSRASDARGVQPSAWKLEGNWLPHFGGISSHSSVQFSSSVVSNSLWPHGLQGAWLPSPSPTPRVYSNSCPLSRWCHPPISSSVVPFSSCLQSFPASGSFLMSQFFASGGQSIGVSASASVLPMNIQDWFPSGLTDLILLKPTFLVYLHTPQF